MPVIARVAQELSYRFRLGPIEDIPSAAFGPTSNLLDAIKAVGIELNADETAFMRAVPAAQQEAIKGALHSAVSSDPRTPVMFAWIPGYDFEVRLFEAEERGGAKSLTVLFASPYRRARAS